MSDPNGQDQGGGDGPGLLALFSQIENRPLRRLLSIVSLFLLSLAIGHVCEAVLSKKALQDAYRAQAVWLDKLRAMVPLALVKGYAADFGPAGAGQSIYKPPPPPPPPLSPQEQAEINQWAATKAACDLARFRPSATCRPPGSASACIVDPDREGCREYAACQAQAAGQLAISSPECAAVSSSGMLRDAVADLQTLPDPVMLAKPEPRVHALLLPLAALSRTLTRLFAGGPWGFALTILQLAMGLMALLLLGRRLKISGDDLHPMLAFLVVLPIGSVAMGSVLALGLKWLMLAAGYLFHEATGLAAMAAGAGGAAGFCWLCFRKLMEQRAEALIAGK